MDWSEIVLRMVILAEEKGQITFAQINELVPPKAAPADIERLIEALNARGIWIVDDQ
jgi:Sigma-70 factor, region 1.1